MGCSRVYRPRRAGDRSLGYNGFEWDFLRGTMAAANFDRAARSWGEPGAGPARTTISGQITESPPSRPCAFMTQQASRSLLTVTTPGSGSWMSILLQGSRGRAARHLSGDPLDHGGEGRAGSAYAGDGDRRADHGTNGTGDLASTALRAPQDNPLRPDRLRTSVAARLSRTSTAGVRAGTAFLRDVMRSATGQRAVARREPRREATLAVDPENASHPTGAVNGAPTQVTAQADRLRVLLLTSEAPPVVSGISRTAVMLSEGLRARGHAVDITSRADFPHVVRNEVRLSAFILYWRRFRRRLLAYDVVVVFGPVPTISEVFLALSMTMHRAHRPAIIYTHHGDLAVPGLAPFCSVYNGVAERLAHRADAIVVTSEAYRAKLSRAGGSRVNVVPWQVDTRDKVQPRAPEQRNLLRILFVGQLRPYKGLRELIRAVAGIPALQLSIIGAGPMLAELQDLASQLNATNVQFRGRVTDEELWRAYSKHDVIVLPSISTAEAFGLVLIEGMAAGCVPVASDLAGVREVAGPTGLLARPGDVHDLRAQLCALARDRDRLHVLQQKSLARAGTLDYDEMLVRYEDLFQETAIAAAHQHEAFAVPANWSTPQAFLEAACASVGTSRASLVLFPRPLDSQPPFVWRREGVPWRIGAAPVAQFVARSREPLVIADVPSDWRVAPWLVRPELSSAILLPVRVTRGSVAVLALSTSVRDRQTLTPDHVGAVAALLPATRTSPRVPSPHFDGAALLRRNAVIGGSLRPQPAGRSSCHL
jgi:glycosyltransferase involved in cell wall biosynthesis